MVYLIWLVNGKYKLMFDLHFTNTILISEIKVCILFKLYVSCLKHKNIILQTQITEQTQ